VVLAVQLHHLVAELTEQRPDKQPLLPNNLDFVKPAYSSTLIALMDLVLQPQDRPLLVLQLVLHLLQVRLLVLPVEALLHPLGISMF
jgi:hypothetical protein